MSSGRLELLRAPSGAKVSVGAIMRERRISISLTSSETGKTKLCCPASGCQPAEFFLGEAGNGVPLGWADRVRREPDTLGVTCPYCGHDADDDEFRHPEDQEFIDGTIDHERDRFGSELMDELLVPLERSMKRLERSTRGGLFQIKLKTTRTRSPIRPRPRRPDRQDLLRNVACGICGRNYGVFALALFCPDCGCPNLATHLDRERDLVETEVRDARSLFESGDRERAHRRLTDAQENLVTVTETFLKTVFVFVVRSRLDAEEAAKTIGKMGVAFQNVERGRKEFAPFNVDPYSTIEDADLEFMAGMMSKRHVVTHNLGMVDEKLVAQTGQGRPGRNIAVSAEDISRFFDLLERVIGYCQDSVPELVASKAV